MSRLRNFFGSGPAPVQPVPQVTEADIDRILRRDFASSQIAEALAILAEYGTQPWHREPARVQLAALKLADGSIEKLRSAVDQAKRDYRNVLAPAEYPKFSHYGFRAVRLRSRERQEIYTDDWQQYQLWLKK